MRADLPLCRRLIRGSNGGGRGERTKEDAMKAQVGDRLVVHGRKVGDTERSGEIVEIRGTEGAPPYLVRWDNGVEDLIIPSSDAAIEPAPQ
jgi:hypothetical protein